MNNRFDFLDFLWYLNSGPKAHMPFCIEKKINEHGKCDIIDIANEEMKKIDSTKIDNEFKKVFTKQYTQNFIELAATGKLTQKDINVFLSNTDKDILYLKVIDTILLIVTRKNIIPVTLANILEIDENYISSAPMDSSRYNFYFIDTKKIAKTTSVSVNYNSEDFVEELKKIGNKIYNDEEIESAVQYLLMDIKDALIDNPIFSKDIEIDVQIENEVVAIEFKNLWADSVIFDVKTAMAKVLSINPDLFIEIVTPIGMALLIDTRRWVLEPDFGDEQWFI